MKFLRLLFLMMLPLLFAACSDDEYKDLQIPGKSIEEPVKVTGYVYNKDGNWYLRTDLRKINLVFGFEDTAAIKINNYPSTINFENIEGIEKTFTVKLTLYDIEHDGPLIVIYHYVADIYEIE